VKEIGVFWARINEPPPAGAADHDPEAGLRA
jgi:hypothetical protein